MTQPAGPSALRVADLPQNRATAFALAPDDDRLAALARDLGLDGLRKLRFEGEIAADGKTDWRLDARLGATVVQPCVVTLAPVTTRIDESLTRRFLARMPDEGLDSGEVEMPEDETIDRLGPVIDLDAVMTEALALALPLYPRADGAALDRVQFTEPGRQAMTDEDARPFAGLKSLRDRLENDD